MKKYVLYIILVVFISGCHHHQYDTDINETQNNIDNEILKYNPSPGKYGGQLVYSINAGPKTFNPIIADEISSTEITSYIFEGLVSFNPYTLTNEPCLAERWEIQNDGLAWDFYLREDVYWSDGKKFTSDDVVYTYNEIIYNKDIPNSSADTLLVDGEKIMVEKIDDYKVRFILPAKFAPFLHLMNQEILPKHKMKEYVDKNSFNIALDLDTNIDEIVGTGAFSIDIYKPGEYIVLKKNSHYWRKDTKGNILPYLDKVTIYFLSNEDMALLKFKNNELDYYIVRGQDYSILSKNIETSNHEIYDMGSTLISNFLVFNQNPETINGKPIVDPVKLKWFKNRKFRKALAYAIDKESIIELVLNSLGTPQWGPLTETTGKFYNPHVSTYEYSLVKAMKELDKLGLIDHDEDGIREDIDGNKLEFLFYTNNDNEERLKIAEIIREDFEIIGVKINFVPLDFNDLVNRLVKTYDWEIILIGLTGEIEPSSGKNVWISSSLMHMWNPTQNIPETSWEARIDEIFINGEKEMNEIKRINLYDEWQEIASEELPLIYTVSPNKIFAIKKGLGNIYPSNYGGGLWNIYEIYYK